MVSASNVLSVAIWLVLCAVFTPPLVSYFASGWTAKYTSPAYSADDIPLQNVCIILHFLNLMLVIAFSCRERLSSSLDQMLVLARLPLKLWSRKELM